MLTRFFKIFFFTTLAIAMVLTALIFIGDSLYDVIGCIFGYEHEQYPVAYAVFTPITLTIASGVLSLLLSLALHFTCKKEVDKAKKSNRFYLCYSIALVVVSLLIILFSMLYISINNRVVETEHTFVLALLFDASVIEAIVLAGLSVSIFTLWKTNRMVAAILGFVTLVILGLNFISGEAIHAAASYNDSYESYDSIPSYNYYDDDSYDDYEVYEEVEEDYLSFLWTDDDNVSSAFAHFFSHTINRWGDDYPSGLLSDFYFLEGTLKADSEEDLEANDRLLRKIYSYLIKNPSEILSAFYSYQNIIHQYIPVEQFHETGAQALLQYLSVAHDDLYSDDDQSRLQKIYKLMSNIEHEWVYGYYNDIKLHINDDYKSKFYDKDGDFDQVGIIWTYSFWARRHAEGTDDIAYEIINALREYYSDAEYYHEFDGDYDEDENDSE